MTLLVHKLIFIISTRNFIKNKKYKRNDFLYSKNYRTNLRQPFIGCKWTKGSMKPFPVKGYRGAWKAYGQSIINQTFSSSIY